MYRVQAEIVSESSRESEQTFVKIYVPEMDLYTYGCLICCVDDRDCVEVNH